MVNFLSDKSMTYGSYDKLNRADLDVRASDSEVVGISRLELRLTKKCID